MRAPLTVDTAKLDDVASNQQQQTPMPQPSGLTGGSKVIASGSSEKWTVPTLEDNFDLDKAKGKAYKRAETYMNRILGLDDLQVDVQMQENDRVGEVRDVNTGKLVNSYAGTDLLKVYAQNMKERGIIIDGRV